MAAKRSLRIAIWLAITGLVAGIGFGALGMTAGGRWLVARTIEWSASSSDLKVEIGTIDGSLFSSGHIATIAVSDRRGTWLTIQDAAYSWTPSALLRGRLDIASVRVGAIDILRLPRGDKGHRSSTPPGLPVVGLILGHGEVGQIRVAEALTGEALVLKAVATARLDAAAPGVSGQLSVSRLDGVGGQANLAFAFNTGDMRLRIAGEAVEPSGGVLARLGGFEKRAALQLKLDGDGPLDDWHSTLTISANATPFVAAKASMRRRGDARIVEGQLAGYLQHVLPRAFAALAQGKLEAMVRASWHDDGRIEFETVKLQSHSARAEASGFADAKKSTIAGQLDAQIGRTDRQPIALVLGGGGAFSVSAGTARLRLGAETKDRRLEASLALQDFVTPFGRATVIDVRSSARQQTPTFATFAGLSDIVFEARATGISSADERLKPVIGKAASLTARGELKPAGLAIKDARLTIDAGNISSTGVISGDAVDGSITIKVPKLESLSGLAARTVSGAASLSLNGRIGFGSGMSAVDIGGHLSDVRFGVPSLDRLLAGRTVVSGRIDKAPDGELKFAGFSLKGTQLSAGLDGTASLQRLALTAVAKIAHLSAVDARLTGALTLKASARGASTTAQTTVALDGQNVTLNGAPLKSLAARFIGRGPIDAQSGKLTIDGVVDGRELRAEANVARAGIDGLNIDKLDARFGNSRVWGNQLALSGNAPSGALKIALPDLRELARLAGVPMSGSISADARFDGARGGSPARGTLQLAATGRALSIGDSQIESFNASATVVDSLGSPTAIGKLVIERASAGGISIPKLTLTATSAGAQTALAFQTNANDVAISGSGALIATTSGAELRLETMRAVGRGQSAALAAPTVLRFADGTLSVANAAVSAGGGRIDFAGTAGKTIDMTATVSRLPVALAEMAAPDLGLEGALSGTIEAHGSSSDPRIGYRLAWSGATSKSIREAGLASVDIAASGGFQGRRADISGQIAGTDGLAIAIAGNLKTATDYPLQMSARGTLPLKLANLLMAEQGTHVDGKLSVDLKLAGTATQPILGGTITTQGATFAHSASGVRLSGVDMAARIAGNRLNIERFSASTHKGGTLTGGGSMLLDPRAALPAQFWLKAANLDFEDRRTAAGKLDADLVLTGALLRDATLSGTANVRRAMISVPEKLPSSYAELDLQHRNLPPHLGSLAPKTSPSQTADRSGGGPVTIKLGIRVDAENSIHVRGRGVDARLGGTLAVSGRSDAPRVDGSLALDRGRLSILGRRLDFTRGRMAFSGSITPHLDFEANSQAGDLQIAVTITGSADAPKFAFTSSPQLPEDEVIARFLYNKDLAKLSPVQIAQLASEVDKLGGLTSGPSITDKLRGSVGIDVLDLGTDKKGNAQVSAGRYLGNNLYVGVTQGASPSSSRMVIDLDVTRHVKARGEVGADGNSKIGIGVEWDY